MTIINLAIGNSRKSTYWASKSIGYDDFLTKYLMNTTRTSETVEEYRDMSKAKKSDIKDIGGFVGGKLKKGKRNRRSVISRSAVTLDADYASLTFVQDMLKKFNIRVTIYSTHSHTPDSPRYRIVIPLSEEITASEYDVLVRVLMNEIGNHLFDKTSAQAERLMYFPSTPIDGEFIFEDNGAKEFLDPKKYMKEHVSNLPVPEKVQRPLTKERGADKEGPIGAFCRLYPISRVMDEFLTREYTSTGLENRYTYIEGTGAGGLITYDNDEECTSHHETDPANNGHSNNAFDLLQIHKFDGDSDKAIQFVLKLKDVKAELVEEKLCKDFEDFADTKPPVDPTTREVRVSDKDEDGYMCTINNFVMTIGYHFNIRFNEFTQAVELDNETWKNSFESMIMDVIEKRYKIFSPLKARAAIEIVAYDNRYHPVKKYFKSLPKWDKVPRVEELFIKYFGSPDTLYTRAVVRKMLCAMAKRVYYPGCEYRNMVVLCGPQDLGKSTFFRNLTKKWFNDSFTLLDTRDKTGPEKLLGSLLIEIPELSGMQKASIETVKSFISKRDDIYRPAFGRVVEHIPRQSIFVGTTNAVHGYLKDVTGNTRFLPIYTPVRLMDKIDTDQIWAEILTIFEDEDLNLSKELRIEATRLQNEQLEVGSKYDCVEDYLEMTVPTDWEKQSVTSRILYVAKTEEEQRAQLKASNDVGYVRDKFSVQEIYCEIFEGKQRDITKTVENEILACLRKHGYTESTRKRSRCYGKRLSAYKKSA